MKHNSPRFSVSLAAALALGALLCGTPSAHADWQLVWSDEFNLPDGSSPDPNNWGFDVGGGGWGNNQLEYDTARTNNARIVNGQLVIQAQQESYGGNNYTSARMLTKGKWSWTYGRIEARIKIPRGQGIWPAFWMLGTNIAGGVSWPTCGEIDIMENIGKTSDQGTDHGTIHGPQSGGDYNGGSGVGGTYTLPGGAALADDFHIYAVEWTTNQIKWYLDSVQYFTATPASLPSGGTWVFTAPEFVILNVAVGGNWPGNPDGTTVFPQQMLVDYVHVYASVPSTNPPTPPTGLTASPGNGKVSLNWNAPASGATGYNVKRSTVSGGSYTTIASPTANNYTDSGLPSCSTYYYVVSATNSIGESTNSSEAAAALGSYALAVNSGGSAAGQFIADAYFSGGSTSTSVPSVDTSAVTSPAPQAVYQSERHGVFTYTFTGLTAGMNYKVRLHFAENYWTAVGQRIFNVSINGKQVLTNFDIIAVAGAQNKATIQEFMSFPTSTNTIVVSYSNISPAKDQPKASGIEILLPPPAAPVAGNNGPLCAGSALNLTASTVAGATYSWTGPNGFTSAAQNPSLANATAAASGTYSVTATINGCASPAANTLVTVNPVPATPVAGNNGPLCAGSTLNLTASTVAGATYNWTGPNGFTSSAQNPSIANATTGVSGTYIVTVSVGTCVSLPASTLATVNPNPATPVAGNNGPLCAGSTLNLTAATVPGATYSWTGPNGFASTTQNPSIANATTGVSGTYSVTAIVGGCASAPAGTLVTVNPTPAAPVAGNNGPICAGTTLHLTASTVAGATYSWTGPNGFTSTEQNPSIANATNSLSGGYVVIATVGGCASAPAITMVAVNALPATPVAGNNGPLAEGATLNLTASTIPGATYSWTGPNGFTSTDQNPSLAGAAAAASGLYSVTATANACPSVAATTAVVINPGQSVSIQRIGSDLILNWTSGTLQSAIDAGGPWNDLSEATSPYTNTPSGPQQFYRVRIPQ